MAEGEQGTAGRTDVLALMLDARDDAGLPLSDEELHDELITLLVAGHETTATALAWTHLGMTPPVGVSQPGLFDRED